MKSVFLLAFLSWAIFAIPTSAFGASILLNAESPETGSNLGSSPLITPLGAISFAGLVIGNYEEDMGPDSNHIFSTDNGTLFGTTGQIIQPAHFLFDFDVESVTFIYGGNSGNILVEALDGAGLLVDSFFQANTGPGQPKGPVTLMGGAIRQLRFNDTTTFPPGGHLAALDNITITTVPETTSMLLAIFAAIISLSVRRR